MKKRTISFSPETPSPFSKQFRLNIKNNGKIFIINLILQFSGIPLFLLLRDLDNQYLSTVNEDVYVDKTTALYLNLSELSLFITAVAVLSGIFTALFSFRYLHRKSGSDIVMSLPLNRNQLFAADFLSGLVTYILPYIIAILSTLPLIMSWSRTETSNEYYYHFLSMHIYCVPDPKYILNFEVMLLTAMLFLYSFTVLITVCCGTVFESIEHLILSNLSVYLLHESTENIKTSVSDYYEVIYSYKSLCLCPLDALYDCFLSLGIEITEINISRVINCLLMSAICCAASFIIFKGRKSEKSGSPLPVKFVFNAVNICLTAAAVSYLSDLFCKTEKSKTYFDNFPAFLLMSLAASFSIFFILTFLNNRKIRFLQSPRKLILPLAGFAVSAAFFTAYVNTGAFGAKYYIPDARYIAEATVKFKAISCTCTDTDEIRLITDLHHELNTDLRKSLEDSSIKEKYEKTHCAIRAFRSDYPLYSGYDDESKKVFYWDNTEEINIHYKMKNGKEYHRLLVPYLTDFMKSDIYKAAVEEYRSIMNDPDHEIHEIISEVLFGSSHVKTSEISAEISRLISDRNFSVFCGRTKFEKELSGCSSFPYVSSVRDYPYEYILTKYDRKQLEDIISKSYFPYYYDTRDCFIVTIVLDEAPETDIEQTVSDPETFAGIKKPVKLKLFLPPEYADMYNEFLQKSNCKKIEWTEKPIDYRYDY